MSRTTTTQADAGRQVLDGALTAADFLLGPEAFVDRCADTVALGYDELPKAERVFFAETIRAGRPRLEVMRAIMARRFFDRKSDLLSPSNGINQDWNSFVVVDLLVRFAPGDNERFVRQAYEQIIGRPPSSVEALEARFDLGRQTVDREGFIERLADRAPNARLSSEKTLDARSKAGQAGSLAIGGITIDPAGRTRIVIIHQVQGLGWVVAPDIWFQKLDWEQDFPRVHGGLVLAGPKRSLPAGSWEMTVDLLQPEGARIVVDIVANSAMDTLLRFELVGPAHLTVRFDIQPFHNFIELRLHKPDEAPHLHHLKLRQLSLAEVSQ